MPTTQECALNKGIAEQAVASSLENRKNIEVLSKAVDNHAELCIVKHENIEKSFLHIGKKFDKLEEGVKSINSKAFTILLGVVSGLFGIVGVFIYLYVLTK